MRLPRKIQIDVNNADDGAHKNLKIINCMTNWNILLKMFDIFPMKNHYKDLGRTGENEIPMTYNFFK